MKAHVFICCLILSVLRSQAAEFDLGTNGNLSVTIPKDWTVRSKALDKSDGTPIGYLLGFELGSPASAKGMVTFFYERIGFRSKENINQLVLRACEEFVSGSVEQKKNVTEFSLQKGYGAYCLFTDASLVGKKAKPDQHKVMGSGVVQPAENMMGSVSLFADKPDSMEFKAMIRIINSIKVKPSDAK
jgi:hypothetical protein